MPASAQQAQSIMSVLDNWELSTQEIGVLLGLYEVSPRQLQRFRQGSALPSDINLQERVTHIDGISKALDTSFPKNSYMGRLWLRTPHRRFHQQPPLATMLEKELTGLVMVRCELDCAFSWEHSQQTKEPK